MGGNSQEVRERDVSNTDLNCGCFPYEFVTFVGVVAVTVVIIIIIIIIIIINSSSSSKDDVISSSNKGTASAATVLSVLVTAA